MTHLQSRQYEIYPIDDEHIYALLDQAHCAIVRHDDESITETLHVAATARYENMQLHDSIAQFDVYCENGYAFRLSQVGPSIEHTFLFHSPTIVAFSKKLTFKQAMDLGNVSFGALIYANPFLDQSLYDMAANLPSMSVSRQEAAFALARLSIVSWIAFSFESVHIYLQDEDEGAPTHEENRADY